MQHIEAVPAYGRVFKTAKEAKASWNDGQDWRDTWSGRYLSIRDVDTFGLSVVLRYGINLEKVASV